LFCSASQASALGRRNRQKKQSENPIELPSLDFNGYSGKFSADQSRIWKTQDPSSQYQARQAASQPYFGLKLSRPLE
jgi:hypothetical protein